MAKKKNVTQEDLKQLFEKAKTSLQQLGKETGTWLKKGEAELSRLSKIGKLELDVVNLSVKRDKVFKDIGRKVVEQNLDEQISSAAVKNLCGDVRELIGASVRKKREIAKVKKGLLKGNAKSKRKAR